MVKNLTNDEFGGSIDMSGFISALIKQRRDAKKAGPDTSGRLKEIIDIIRKYDYDDGITPEIVVGSIGYVVSVFFAYSLYKNMKKGK